MSDAFARARPDSQPAASPTRPTPSMLAYAFGERVAPPAGRVRGKLVPCSGRMVDGDELAVTMVHVALWDLIRHELIAFETHRPAVTRDLTTIVRPELRATGDEELRGSLEYLLYRSARSGREDREVGEVVAHLYPREIEDPFAYIFELENVAMIEARLMRRDVEGKVAVVPGTPPPENQLVWLCENVARHIVSFTTTQAEWDRYRLQDEVGFRSVHSAIRAAIGSRRSRSERELE